MKEIIKAYWLDILPFAVFIIFTFIFPIRKISLICGGFITICLVRIVLNDERIKDPYSSLVGIAIIAAFAWFVYRYW